MRIVDFFWALGSWLLALGSRKRFAFRLFFNPTDPALLFLLFFPFSVTITPPPPTTNRSMEFVRLGKRSRLAMEKSSDKKGKGGGGGLKEPRYDTCY